MVNALRRQVLIIAVGKQFVTTEQIQKITTIAIQIVLRSLVGAICMQKEEGQLVTPSNCVIN